MRLSDQQKRAIVDSFQIFRKGSQAALYLFGSRTDDSKRGGDIDLLLVFETDRESQNFPRLDFVVDLKKKIGDRKIDLTLATKSQLQSDSFLKSIFSGAVLLCSED